MISNVMPQLKIKKLADEDANEDIVRIPRLHRGDIPWGSLVRIAIGAAKRIVIVQGKDGDAPEIYMDLATRTLFGVKAGQIHEVSIKSVNWYAGSLIWAAQHANPALRVSSQLGLLSLFLGLVALIPSSAFELIGRLFLGHGRLCYSQYE
jgi:hypothetical protein